MRATAISEIANNSMSKMGVLMKDFNPNKLEFEQKLHFLEEPLPVKRKPKKNRLEDRVNGYPSEGDFIKPSRIANYTGILSKPYVVIGEFNYNAALSKLGAIFQRLVVTSEGGIGFIRQFHEKDKLPDEIAPLPHLVETKGLEGALYSSIIKIANGIVYSAYPNPDAEPSKKESAIKHMGNSNQSVRDYIRRKLNGDLMAIAGYFVSTHRITKPMLENQLYPLFRKMLNQYILETQDIFARLNDNRAQSRYKGDRWDINLKDLRRKVKPHYRKTQGHKTPHQIPGTPHQFRQHGLNGIHYNYNKGDHSRVVVNVPPYRR